MSSLAGLIFRPAISFRTAARADSAPRACVFGLQAIGVRARRGCNQYELRTATPPAQVGGFFAAVVVGLVYVFTGTKITFAMEA